MVPGRTLWVRTSRTFSERLTFLSWHAIGAGAPRVAAGGSADAAINGSAERMASLEGLRPTIQLEKTGPVEYILRIVATAGEEINVMPISQGS